MKILNILFFTVPLLGYIIFLEVHLADTKDVRDDGSKEETLSPVAGIFDYKDNEIKQIKYKKNLQHYNRIRRQRFFDKLPDRSDLCDWQPLNTTTSPIQTTMISQLATTTYRKAIQTSTSAKITTTATPSSFKPLTTPSLLTKLVSRTSSETDTSVPDTATSAEAPWQSTFTDRAYALTILTPNGTTMGLPTSGQSSASTPAVSNTIKTNSPQSYSGTRSSFTSKTTPQTFTTHNLPLTLNTLKSIIPSATTVDSTTNSFTNHVTASSPMKSPSTSRTTASIGVSTSAVTSGVTRRSSSPSPNDVSPGFFDSASNITVVSTVAGVFFLFFVIIIIYFCINKDKAEIRK